MIAILIAAASLLSQAYLFRDLDRSDRDADANQGISRLDSAYAREAACASTDKTDSSRTRYLGRDR